MSKVLRTAAFVVGAVALVTATGGFAAIGIGAAATAGTAATATAAAVAGTSATIAGISAGTLTLVSAGLSLAGGLLAKKPPATGGGAQTSFKADPNAGIPYLIGRTGTGGNIIFRNATDGWSDKTPNDLSDFTVVFSGAGPVTGFESLAIDKSIAALGSGPISGFYSGYMFHAVQLGAAPESAALTVQAGTSARPTGWTTAHKLSGYAAAMLRLRYDKDGKKYPNGTPAPLWIVKGVKVYDPRLDSTYPGGSGSCRALDETTYVWSENPYLHGLTWCLGRYQNGTRILGAGAPIAGIDVAAFVEGANIADTNGWKVGGVVYSTMAKWDVLKMLLQAGSGEPMRLGAKISCLVNTPRVSLATVGVADVVGEASVTATQPQRERINGIIPRYRSEAHNWEIIPAAPVRVPEYVSADGEQRTREVEYTLCQSLGQVATLARYDIENAREFGPISLPLKLRWMGHKPGDCITVNLPEVGLVSQPVLLLNRALDPGSSIVTMTARSETFAKHAFALGQTTTAPPTPSVSGPPLIPTPTTDEWAIVPPSGDAAIVIVGAADPAIIDGISVEYRAYTGAQAEDDDWIASALVSPSATQVAVVGPAGGGQYQVSVRYRIKSQFGGRLILGPVTMPAIKGNGLSVTGEGWAYINSAGFADLHDDSRIVGRYCAALAFSSNSIVYWCGPTDFVVSPGETLYYQYVIRSDGPTPDTCRGFIDWFDAAGGTAGTTDLIATTNVNGPAVNGVWTVRRATIVVPAGAAYARPNVNRVAWSGAYTFHVGEPYLGRASAIQSGSIIAADLAPNQAVDYDALVPGNFNAFATVSAPGPWNGDGQLAASTGTPLTVNVRAGDLILVQGSIEFAVGSGGASGKIVVSLTVDGAAAGSFTATAVSSGVYPTFFKINLNSSLMVPVSGAGVVSFTVFGDGSPPGAIAYYYRNLSANVMKFFQK